MKDFKIHMVGYRGRLVADKTTGLVGRIIDKYYSGLYEVWFEREPYQQQHVLEYLTDADYVQEFPNRAFRKAEQLELLD